MSIRQLPKYFKIWLVIVVFTIIFLVYTRKTLPEPPKNGIIYTDARDSFIKQVNERFVKTNNKINVKTNVEEENNIDLDEESQVTIDDRMPAAYLKLVEPAENINKSFCKYNFGLPFDFVYKKQDYPPGQRRASPYRVFYNVIEAHNIENIPQVTYASHATANFAYYIPELLRYWTGPVSIAAFVPDLDAALFLEQINQFCYCEPEMYRVSIHIVVQKTLPVSKKDIYFDRPENCVPQDSSKIHIYTEFDDTVWYPINVCRNVAKVSALTKYVLLSDVQLMPSKDLASGFIKMIHTYNKTDTKEVFVLPIFEVAETELVPETKEELINLVIDRKAVYFHGLICMHCQRFPGMDEWMSEYNTTEIEPFLSIKRHYPFHRWEPIFIGTNAEPLFNEELSWEGLQDKMLNTLEMCLMDYNFTILDNAFLTHWPGLKTEKLRTEEWRLPYIKQNVDVYNKTIVLLQTEYEPIEGCWINSTMNLRYKKKVKGGSKLDV